MNEIEPEMLDPIYCQNLITYILFLMPTENSPKIKFTARCIAYICHWIVCRGLPSCNKHREGDGIPSRAPIEPTIQGNSRFFSFFSPSLGSLIPDMHLWLFSDSSTSVSYGASKHQRHYYFHVTSHCLNLIKYTISIQENMTVAKTVHHLGFKLDVCAT